METRMHEPEHGSDHMDGRVPIFFADDHGLIRTAIAALLVKRNPKFSVIESDSYDALIDSIIQYRRGPLASVGNRGLILTDLVMPGMMIHKSFPELARRFPDMPVMVLSGMYKNSDITAMMNYGVRAFIPKTSTATLLSHAIELVLDGEKYFPVDYVVRAENDNDGPLSHLSRREQEVATRIADGLTNKEIARNIGIAEGTVKVVAKAIFKKLNVKNRTLLAKLLFDYNRSAGNIISRGNNTIK